MGDRHFYPGADKRRPLRHYRVTQLNVRLDQWVVVNPSVFATSLEDSAVLLDIQSGRYFEFDTVGSDIWTRIAQPCRVDALCADLALGYDASLDRIRASVLTFLSHLAAQGLVEVRDA